MRIKLAATMTEEISKEESPVTKICPPPSELCAIKKNIPCPEEGCNIIFFTSSNLDMHLLKHHKRNFNNIRKYGTNCQFHCPVEKCPYNVNSIQFFKSLKYLKQHYLKVHAKKSFQCVKCQKGFPTEATMKRHTKSCGVKFTCSCNYTYTSYEALLTHAKRKMHSFDDKYKLYGKALIEVSDVENAVSSGDYPTQTTITVPVHLLAAVALSELSGKCSGGTTEKGVQTDACAADSKRSRKASSPTKACERASKRRMSAQTQTGVVGKWKQPKISAQTQTSGDSILMKAMQNADISVSPENQFFQINSAINVRNKQHRKSMETQTTSQKHQDNNTYHLSDLQLETLDEFPSSAELSLTDNASSYRIGIDVGIPDLWVNQKNSSGTQTSPVVMKSLIDQEELLSNSVTQTDLNFALFETESCEVNVNHDSQTSNIQRYFEDNSNCSFVAAAQASTQNYEQDLANATCQENTTTLGALTDEPGYSAAQMENILQRNQVFGVNRSCNTETQTEVEITNSFLAECTDDGDTSFTLCSTIETQTTEDFQSFELPSSNMCTQTCDDVLFSALEFVNNETQTAWPQFAASDDSMFVSTETQTALSGCLSNYSLNSSNWFNPKGPISETSHMETQTDIDEFRQLIAELSKQDSEDKLL